ncbi:MAG: type II toxin-antitoxin system RelE/ParE family toxin [Elusimicrobiota bacterium]
MAKPHREEILRDLNVLQLFGNLARRPLSAPLRDKIFELRSTKDEIQYRTLYFFWKGRMIIVSHIIVKKTQRVPNEEIAKAIKNLASWIGRFGGPRNGEEERKRRKK